MFWNNLTGDERLRLWKDLRSELKDMDLDIKLSHISKFFANMPYGARSLDYYNPLDWPTPWEILFYGTFCKSSISLLMAYTLLISDKSIEDICLYLIDDGEDVYLLPVINSMFYLNFELGKVNSWEDIKDDLVVKQIFSKKQIKYFS